MQFSILTLQYSGIFLRSKHLLDIPQSRDIGLRKIEKGSPPSIICTTRQTSSSSLSLWLKLIKKLHTYDFHKIEI